NSRTPMQWSNAENAGFTTGKPWMGVNPNFMEINVEKQLADEDSVLHFYKKMIQLKKANKVFTYGVYDLLLEEDPQLYVYTRTLGEEKVIVVTNLSRENAVCRVPENEFRYEALMLANNHVDRHKVTDSINLKPYEARIYRLA